MSVRWIACSIPFAPATPSGSCMDAEICEYGRADRSTLADSNCAISLLGPDRMFPRSEKQSDCVGHAGHDAHRRDVDIISVDIDFLNLAMYSEMRGAPVADETVDDPTRE